MSKLQLEQSTIGNYLLGKTIGSGTFGKVKLGVHNITKEKVAIKILEKSKIVEKDDYERVKREMHILKQLHHPHIIQLYEIIENDDYLFLCMEYAENGEQWEDKIKSAKKKNIAAQQIMKNSEIQALEEQIKSIDKQIEEQRQLKNTLSQQDNKLNALIKSQKNDLDDIVNIIDEQKKKLNQSQERKESNQSNSHSLLFMMAKQMERDRERDRQREILHRMFRFFE